MVDTDKQYISYSIGDFLLSFLCRSKECEENEVSIGFVLKILWGTKISLDGDGGFRLGHSGAIITP